MLLLFLHGGEKRVNMTREASPGWEELRPEDCGQLWEHMVLETLLSLPVTRLHFWRDKQQREVGFVIPRGRDAVDAIECKWSALNLDVRNLQLAKAAIFTICPPLPKPFLTSALKCPSGGMFLKL
jgi:predicted AAA+ superfamily ATPase